MNINIDGAPILGEHPDMPGFFNAVTSNGYTLGPIVGQITADLYAVAIRPRPICIFDFSLQRMAAMIEINGIFKYYGHHPVLKNCSTKCLKVSWLSSAGHQARENRR